MNCTLKRTRKTIEGIFSMLFDDQNQFICYALERAYPEGDGYAPKLQNGVYRCVRGEHRLASMKHDFTTFEIMGVVGHSGILFHTGNFNSDSNGCVLLGWNLGELAGKAALISSRLAFENFMTEQKDINEFSLMVTGG